MNRIITSIIACSALLLMQQAIKSAECNNPDMLGDLCVCSNTKRTGICLPDMTGHDKTGSGLSCDCEGDILSNDEFYEKILAYYVNNRDKVKNALMQLIEKPSPFPNNPRYKGEDGEKKEYIDAVIAQLEGLSRTRDLLKQSGVSPVEQQASALPSPLKKSSISVFGRPVASVVKIDLNNIQIQKQQYLESKRLFGRKLLEARYSAKLMQVFGIHANDKCVIPQQSCICSNTGWQGVCSMVRQHEGAQNYKENVIDCHCT